VKRQVELSERTISLGPTPLAGRTRPPVRRLPNPRVQQIDGLSGFGALPVELKDLTHRRLEVVVTRTLAARGDQLGVGTDGQAERAVLCF